MASAEKWFSTDIPAGWGASFARSVIVAVVAFVVMQAKEWVDAGAFDVAGTGVDALLIAAGVFIVNAGLMWAKSKMRATTRDRVGG
jgi:hypothetical protein